MHILFLSDNFPPEVNAAASRVYERAKYWAEWGHQVTVITCAPNFPEGELFKGYKNKWYQVEEMDRIRVVRVKTFITANKGFMLRVLDFISYMMMAIIAGLFQKKPDVIVATSPQFFAAVGGYVLSVLKRKPFVFELSDLWPASIKAVMPPKKNNWMFKQIEKLELFLYRRASAVIALTHAFKKDLVSRGISPDKIAVIYNGVNLDFYQPQAKNQQLLDDLNIKDKFIVGYIGTHGMAHALENILFAAKQLENVTKIHFLFVGAGAKRDALITQAQALRLDNVTFISLKPKNEIVNYWGLCDLALVHLKNDPVFSTVIPSKIFEAMAMAHPIIYAGPSGEASALIERDNIGMVVEAENPDSLAVTIKKLVGDEMKLALFKQNCQLAVNQYKRETQASRYSEALEAVVKGQGNQIVNIQQNWD